MDSVNLKSNFQLLISYTVQVQKFLRSEQKQFAMLFPDNSVYLFNYFALPLGSDDILA